MIIANFVVFTCLLSFIKSFTAALPTSSISAESHTKELTSHVGTSWFLTATTYGCNPADAKGGAKIEDFQRLTSRIHITTDTGDPKLCHALWVQNDLTGDNYKNYTQSFSTATLAATFDESSTDKFPCELYQKAAIKLSESCTSGQYAYVFGTVQFNDGDGTKIILEGMSTAAARALRGKKIQ